MKDMKEVEDTLFFTDIVNSEESMHDFTTVLQRLCYNDDFCYVKIDIYCDFLYRPGEKLSFSVHIHQTQIGD